MSVRDSSLHSPRVLVVSLGALGDVIHGLPVVNALRAGFPGSLVACLVEQQAACLLEGHRALDELIPVPQGWLRSPSTLWELRRRLRAMAFDVAIDVQGATRSALAAWLSGAKQRIGFDGADGRGLSRRMNTDLVLARARHVVDCNLELLRPLGIHTPTVRFDLTEQSADRKAAGRIIRRVRLEGGFAMVSPGTGSPRGLWPAERFAAVARCLCEDWGLPTIVVWSGEHEQRRARQIVAQANGYAWPAPATSLNELASLARQTRLFLGPCTGPLYLADAVGAPCIGLCGPDLADRIGPYGRRYLTLHPQEPEISAEGPVLQGRVAPRASVMEISAESVCAACEGILRGAMARAA